MYHNLYNLYHRVKFSRTVKHNILFDYFHKCDFDIELFKSKYTPIILDEYLESYIDEISRPEKIDYVKCMIDFLITYSPRIRNLDWIKDVYYPKFKIT